MSNIKMFATLAVLVVAVGAGVNLILAPMLTEIDAVTAGTEGSRNASNPTNTTLTVSGNKLFTDPVGYMLDYLNPLNIESIATSQSSGNIAVEVVEKTIAIGSLLVGFVSGVLNGNSGQAAMGLITFIGITLFKIMNDLSPIFALIPEVGTAIFAVVIMGFLAIMIYIYSNFLAGSGG